MTNLTASELLKRYEEGERDFSGAILHNAKLDGAILSGISLKGANIRNVSLSNAYLMECDFSNAIIVGISLMNAILYLSKLEGATFTNANLNKANLGQANLKGADLTTVEFVDACLKDANLRETRPAIRSHAYWAELISQKAETDQQKMLACFIAGGRRFGWDWDDYLNWEHPLEEWAIQALFSFDLDFKMSPGKEEQLKKAANRARIVLVNEL
jgi:hypothetical protein